MNGIDSLIEKIQEQIVRIEKGVVKAREAEDFFAESIRNAKAIFVKDTDEWRILDRWENESGYIWHPVYKSGGYANEKLKNKLKELLEKIKEIAKIEPIVNTKENEYSFSANQKYEAYRLLISIFKGANESVWVIDSFLDEVIFDFIDVIYKQASIKIITDDQKPIFKRLYLPLKEKNEVKIEAKTNNSSHDRYIVIDEKIIYGFGASINTIGKKDFMIHRLNEKKEEVLIKIKRWWSDGQEII